MINIHQKTLQDLEFATVLNQVSEYCITALGNEAALSISPYKDKETLLFSLQLTNEYISSFYNDNRIPNHGFDPITKELKLLNIENTFLEPHSLKKLVSIVGSHICLFVIAPRSGSGGRRVSRKRSRMIPFQDIFAQPPP